MMLCAVDWGLPMSDPPTTAHKTIEEKIIRSVELAQNDALEQAAIIAESLIKNQQVGKIPLAIRMMKHDI